ncbi:ATP-binding protein [Actinomadura yumaensis]|uniref:ATP-binding protein n=1 Tax=Actinomadura yumaensis TaxID=111807 RepID=A0ABW2CIY8_9ACTN
MTLVPPAPETVVGEAAAATRERDEAEREAFERGGAVDEAWDLPAEIRAAARARELTGRALRGWHVSDPTDVDDIVLMVDELITNAVVHGGGPVRLRLRLDGSRVIGEVSDANPAGPPAPKTPDPLDWAEAGRGLLLVGALSSDFGTRPDAVGKTVWFSRVLHGTRGAAHDAPTPATARGTNPLVNPERISPRPS